MCHMRDSGPHTHSPLFPMYMYHTHTPTLPLSGVHMYMSEREGLVLHALTTTCTYVQCYVSLTMVV